jgi:hypothetical protein
MNYKDFDFDEIEKRMPYKAPDNFFDNAFENTLKQAKKTRRTAFLRVVKLSTSAAAVIAVLFMIGLFVLNTNRGVEQTNITSYVGDSLLVMPANMAVRDTSISVNDILNELSDQDLEDILNNVEIEILYAGL